MEKVKKLLPNFLKDKESKNDKLGNDSGKLVSDALPVDQGENNNVPQSLPNSPTASTELTESVVRELSNPNYNSTDMMPTDQSALVNGNANGPLMPNAAASAGGQTMNTMNVHNAQQLVMQFSNVNKLHLGSVYNFNSNVSTTSTRKSSTTDEAGGMGTSEVNSNDSLGRRTRKTKSIVIMMQSTEEPTHRMLDTIATHLGEGWKQVMRDLGHSEGQIEQAIIDHQIHGGIKEVIYQLLLSWLRNADDGVGTLGTLTTLLWESNQRECVQRMKLVYKSQSLSKKSSQS